MRSQVQKSRRELNLNPEATLFPWKKKEKKKKNFVKPPPFLPRHVRKCDPFVHDGYQDECKVVYSTICDDSNGHGHGNSNGYYNYYNSISLSSPPPLSPPPPPPPLSPLSVPACRQIPRQVCRQVPRPRCLRVPRQECKQVSVMDDSRYCVFLISALCKDISFSCRCFPVNQVAAAGVAAGARCREWSAIPADISDMQKKRDLFCLNKRCCFFWALDYWHEMLGLKRDSSLS